MGQHERSDAPRSQEVDRKDKKSCGEHDPIGKSLVEVVAHLNDDACRDCECAIAGEVKNLRHEVTADDQLFEKGVQANENNRESREPKAQQASHRLWCQMIA